MEKEKMINLPGKGNVSSMKARWQKAQEKDKKYRTNTLNMTKSMKKNFNILASACWESQIDYYRGSQPFSFCRLRRFSYYQLRIV